MEFTGDWYLPFWEKKSLSINQHSKQQKQRQFMNDVVSWQANSN